MAAAGTCSASNHSGRYQLYFSTKWHQNRDLFGFEMGKKLDFMPTPLFFGVVNIYIFPLKMFYTFALYFKSGFKISIDTILIICDTIFVDSSNDI